MFVGRRTVLQAADFCSFWWLRHIERQVSVLGGDGEHFCSGLDLAGLRGGQQKEVQHEIWDGLLSVSPNGGQE